MIDFIERIRTFGLEWFKRYYSIYPAEVIDVNDPDKLGRIKFKCATVFGPDYVSPHWAFPHDWIAGKNHGEFHPPYAGDHVYVSFEHGDPRQPVWHGGYYGESELPSVFSDNYPNVRGWSWKSGQKFLIDETADNFKISLINPDGSSFVMGGAKGQEVFAFTHSNGAKILISGEGDVSLQDKSGKEKLNLKDGEVGIDGGKFNFNADGEANIKAKGKAVFSGDGGTTVGSMAAPTIVNGQTVMLAGEGGLPIAIVGSKTVTPVLGVPCIGTVIQGSTVVTSK